MWNLIFSSLYFFLPAYCANMAPILFRWLPWGKKPIWEKKLGDHKTWRGLVVGIIFGTLIFLLQKWFHTLGFQQWSLIDYPDYSLLLGVLLSSGALAGDLIKSYYKRKAEIKPGERWFPWDQLDFFFGALTLSFIVYVPRPEVVLILFVVSPILHFLANALGYWLKINKKIW